MSEYNEPWKVEDGRGHYVVDANGDQQGMDFPSCQRIALCVNYCRGLSNKEIERLLLKSDNGGGI